MLYYRIRKKIICKKRGFEKNQDMEGLLLNPVEIPVEIPVETQDMKKQDKQAQHHTHYITMQ